MKIAIIEDNEDIMRSLVSTLEGRHESFQVLVRDQDVEQIVEMVKTFGPDLVLLDHDLEVPYNAFNGHSIARALGLPKEKMFGISGSFTQDYCARSFQDKHRLFLHSNERGDPCHEEVSKKNREYFLGILEKPVS